METQQNDSGTPLWKQSTLFAAGLLVGLLIGFLVWRINAPAAPEPDACEPVKGINISKDIEKAEVTVNWSNDIKGQRFLILVHDISDPENEVLFNSYQTEENTFVLKGLMSKRNYRIDLFAECVVDSEHVMYSKSTSGSFNTLDWIVIDDVVHIGERGKNPTIDGICNNFDACSTHTVVGNRFEWLTTGKEYFRVSITINGATQESVVTYLEKDFTVSGSKKVHNYLGFMCSDTEGVKNPPGLCAPDRMCGVFTDTVNGIMVNYTLTVDASGCSVNFDAPAVATNYSVRVTKCQ